MRSLLLFIMTIVPLLCWGQSSNTLPNCGAQTEIVGAACFVSDDLLVTSYSLTEFSEEGSVKVVIGQDGRELSYVAKVISSDPQKGWSIIKIDDPHYYSKVAIKYGITNNPLKTVLYLNEHGDISVGKLINDGHDFVIRQSVTQDRFDTPLSGSPVFDNLGHLVAIVSEPGTGKSAQAVDALPLKEALRSLGVTLATKDIDETTIKRLVKVIHPYMVRIKLDVSGSSYYKNYCAYYTEAHSALESKNYARALDLFARAGQSNRKPKDNDIEEQKSLCKYWIFRNKGDEYAEQYQLDLAKNQYDSAYAQNVSWSLRSEIWTKKDELPVFSNSIASGDAYYANRDYKMALEMYRTAENASIKPKENSDQRIALAVKLEKSNRKYRNSQKTQTLMANVAPGWSYGLTYGVAPKSVGWFINLMSSTNFSGLGTAYSCGFDRFVNEQSVAYSGYESHVRMFGQTGLLIRAGRVVLLKLGVGYGIDNYYLDTQEYGFVLDKVKSYQGIQCSGGLMLWLGSWSVSLDLNMYSLSSSGNGLIYEPQLGVGFRF